MTGNHRKNLPRSTTLSLTILGCHLFGGCHLIGADNITRYIYIALAEAVGNDVQGYCCDFTSRGTARGKLHVGCRGSTSGHQGFQDRPEHGEIETKWQVCAKLREIFPVF